MPSNSFTVGRDISLTIVTPSGVLTIPGLTEFSADPETTKLKSKAIDGTTRHAVIPDGWKGSFKVDRIDPTLDNYWAQFEASYFSGVNITAATITEVLQEADGSITEWRYEGVVLDLDKAGDYGGDKLVSQSLSFMASRKIKVS